jgi:hypothetical protein
MMERERERERGRKGEVRDGVGEGILSKRFKCHVVSTAELWSVDPDASWLDQKWSTQPR